MRLARAVRQKVFDELLQFYTVMPEYFGDLPLLRRELPDDFVREKLRAFAQRGERRLELVRHVPQKAVLLLLEIGEPLAHPVEPLAELLQILGAADLHRRAEIGLRRAARIASSI